MFKKKLTESPLYYWEEKSYMMVIPSNEEENLVKDIITRVSSIKDVEIKAHNLDEEKGCGELKIEYENEEYEVGFFIGGISVPKNYLRDIVFSDSERARILKAKKALTIFMKFSENVKKSYHLELKLAVAMVPDLIGVMDESAEKMLSSKWVMMTANSEVLPSSKNLFSVQAVIDNDKKVWLHTHGLCRCGITELEILDSDENNEQNHYNLLNTYAMYLLDKKEKIEPNLNGVYIGNLENGYPIVVTCVSWTKGILEYKKLALGGIKDRKEGHNSKTSIVFVYKNEKDEKNKKLSKVSIYDKLLGENPLLFFSDEETSRMKKLAIERFGYVKKAYSDKNNAIIIKIGLPLEEKGKFEHIWFELLEFKGDKFKARLTQEPYYFDNIHKGYEEWYTVDDITDWIIYTPKFSINPDNVFLLER